MRQAMAHGDARSWVDLGVASRLLDFTSRGHLVQPLGVSSFRVETAAAAGIWNRSTKERGWWLVRVWRFKLHPRK